MKLVDTSMYATDTRGLPYSYDPHEFYEYKSAQVVANSQSGLEMLIWKIIPYSYIRSFAIAIDPLYKLKVSPVRISSPTRTRYKISTSLVYDIDEHLVYTYRYYSTEATPLSCGKNYKLRGSNDINRTTKVFKNTYKYKTTCVDTSRRTRPFGVDFGEAEWFQYDISSPSRQSIENRLVRTFLPIPASCSEGQKTRDERTYVTTYTSGGYLRPDVIESLRLQVSLDANLKIQKRGFELVRRAMPEHRDFNLGRSIVELRDLPRSIESLQKSLGDLVKLSQSLPKGINWSRVLTNLDNIPNEYLSYVFGWRQLYNDIMSTLQTPKKVTKRINRLITRNGLATSYSSSSKFEDSTAWGSGFTYPTSAYDYAPRSTTHVLRRKFDLHCILNAKFDFPPLDLVTFRSDKFLKYMGFRVGPSDLYDLVPWTWLYDWFTGLGNYLHVIEEITSDRSLINFGFISCKTTGSLETLYTYRQRNYSVTTVNGVSTGGEVYTTSTHTSALTFSHYVRKDAATIADVKAASDESTLSTYQRIVLGALFAQRAKL